MLLKQSADTSGMYDQLVILATYIRTKAIIKIN